MRAAALVRLLRIPVARAARNEGQGLDARCTSARLSLSRFFADDLAKPGKMVLQPISTPLLAIFPAATQLAHLA